MSVPRTARLSENRFAAAMAGHRFGPAGNTAPVVVAAPARPPTPAPRPPDPDGLILGELDAGGAIAIDIAQLLAGRLLIQGVSGAGKSWALRRLLEQASGQVQLIVIDPEGEFGSLASALEALHVPGHGLGRVAMRQLARRARQHRLSLVLDLSDMDRTGQMIAVAAFLEGAIEAPREHWHPVLVAIDEAHLFAPFGGHSAAETSVRKAAIGAVVDLMGRGRKRGLAGILATQRLARLAKSVSSEVSNFLVGQNTQDLDIKRAAEQIGWPARKAFDRLPLLRPGEFVAVGRAFSQQPAQLKVGGIRSTHHGAAPALAAPPKTDATGSRQLVDLDGLIAESTVDVSDAGEARLRAGTRAVRTFIRDASFVAAGGIFAALKAVAPQGVTVANLAAHLGLDAGDIAEAIALLDQHGVVDFTAAGAAGPVALAKEFTP